MPPFTHPAKVLQFRLKQDGGDSTSSPSAGSLEVLERSAEIAAAPSAVLFSMCEVPPGLLELGLPGASSLGIRARVQPAQDGPLEDSRKGDWCPAFPLSDASTGDLLGISLQQKSPWSSAGRVNYLRDELGQVCLQVKVLSGEVHMVLAASTTLGNGSVQYRWPEGFDNIPLGEVTEACLSLHQLMWTFPGAGTNSHVGGIWQPGYAAAYEYYAAATRTTNMRGPFQPPENWLPMAKAGLEDFCVPLSRHGSGRLAPELALLKGYDLAVLFEAFVAYYREHANPGMYADDPDHTSLVELASAVFDGHDTTIVYQLLRIDAVSIEADGVTKLSHVAAGNSSLFAEHSAFSDGAGDVDVRTSDLLSPQGAETLAPLLSSLGPSDLESKRSIYTAISGGVDASGSLTASSILYAGVTAATVPRERRSADVQRQRGLVRSVERAAKAAVGRDGDDLISVAKRVRAAGPLPSAAGFDEWMSRQDSTYAADCATLCSTFGRGRPAYVVHSALTAAQVSAAGGKPALIVGAWSEECVWDTLCKLEPPWVEPMAFGKSRSLLWAEGLLLSVFRALLRDNPILRPLNHLVTADALPGAAGTRAGRLMSNDALAATSNLQVALLLRIIESEWTVSEVIRSIDSMFGLTHAGDAWKTTTGNVIGRLLGRVEDVISVHQTRAAAVALDRFALVENVVSRLTSHHGEGPTDGSPALSRNSQAASAALARVILYGLSLSEADVERTRAAVLASLRSMPQWPSGTEHDRLDDDFLRAAGGGIPPPTAQA